MKKILLSLLATSALFASQCTYDLKELKVEWKAYKTPLKIGVGGTFDKVSFSATDKSSTKALLASSTIVIDTASIDSKNSGRDAKLVNYFFETQGVKEITIKVLSVEHNRVNLAVTMNGITKTVPMKLDLERDEAEGEGYIDLADFKMLPSLSAITKACYDLHQGKTWQDVEIEFELKTKKECH
jgi:polyisoprenoid-binding protein YceI